MWLAMMTAMMAPAAWPWVRAFHRFGVDVDAASGARGGDAVVFERLPRRLARLFRRGGAAAAGTCPRCRGFDGRHSPTGGGGHPSVAGLYQFAPQKRACLTHCRNPITYFLSRWRNGSPAGFRLGFGHGVFCVGCCWALMATALVVGMANLWWMAALTAVAFIEQVVPHGDRIRMPLGITLIAAGLLQM